MYDAILISTHYSYRKDGAILPTRYESEWADLSMTVPLGVIHIAQYLHDGGFNVRVVHLAHEMKALRPFGLAEDERGNLIEEILKRYPARVCGIQVHWYLYCGGAVYIANLYKKLFPESRVLLGGYMAAAYWKEFLKISKAIDGVIVGEGEKPFQRFLEKTLDSPGSNLPDVTGAAVRGSNDELIFKPAEANDHLDRDEIPIIHPEARPFSKIFWQKRHFINISRGRCPEKCAYCAGNNREINTRIYQTIKIRNIIEQLRVYEKFGFQDLFLGENHFLNLPFMTELMDSIIKENFSMVFELETHPVMFDRQDLLEKMIAAKFLRFTMGCESGSNSVMKRMGRNSGAAEILSSVKGIAEQGGIVLTSWISNLPGETESEFQETQKLMYEVVKAGGLIYWIENLHVFPGTRLHKNAADWGIEILLKSIDDWMRWSLVSKQYVSFEEARKDPMKYLTHLNCHISPEKMIERFYSNRRLAASLVPEMKFNLENGFSNLPPEILETELRALDWYEQKGWKLWLF